MSTASPNENFTVAQLKVKLEDLGLSTDGNKPDLVKRLDEAQAASQGSTGQTDQIGGPSPTAGDSSNTGNNLEEVSGVDAIAAAQQATGSAPQDGTDGPLDHAETEKSDEDALKPAPGTESTQQEPKPPRAVGSEVGEAPAGGLIGSSVQPSHVMVGGLQVQLGEAVSRAFGKSGLTGLAWNELEAEDREARIAEELDAAIAATADAAEEEGDGKSYRYTPISGQALNLFGGVPAEGVTFKGKNLAYEAFLDVYFTREEVEG